MLYNISFQYADELTKFVNLHSEILKVVSISRSPGFEGYTLFFLSEYSAEDIKEIIFTK